MVNTKDFRDELRVEGVNSRGYGLIAKIVMLDRKLTIEAKSIYSYFCSYAGAGSQVFPSIEKIISDLCISKDRFYKHFKFLKNYGYIKVKKRLNKNGTFKSNLYTLVANPIPIKNIENDNNKQNIYPCPENPDTDNPTKENTETNTNNPYIINNLPISKTTTTECTYSKEENGNSKVVVENNKKSKFTQKDIEELNEKINNQIGQKVNDKTLKNVLIKFGYDYVLPVINKLANIISKNVYSVDSFLYKAIESESKGMPYIEKTNSYNQKPVQTTNYEQREYDDDFWDDCYDNFKINLDD